MAKCEFQFPVDGNVSNFLDRAWHMVRKSGGQVSGDDSEGTILINTPLGKIEAEYSVDVNVVHITITKKPLIVGCRTIQDLVIERLK